MSKGFVNKKTDEAITLEQVGFFPEDKEVPWIDDYEESDFDSHESAIEINVAEDVPKQKQKKKDENQDEKQGTPLADSGETDYSKGKTFKLPCSNRELGKMMREVGIDGINDDFIKVKITNSVCPALSGMEVENPNFHELNFLAKRLKKMPTEDLKAFNKIIAYEWQLNPELSPKDVINISYNLDNYKVFDVSKSKTIEERFEKLGEQLNLKKFDGETDDSYKERLKLNGEKFADTKINDTPAGGFTENAFITKLAKNKEIYQSSDDIPKLSGFIENIKNGLKWS